jgi:hypothetical protein
MESEENGARSSKELNNLSPSPNIVKMLKIRKRI